MDDGTDDVERGVGEAEHEQQRQLVLDGQEEEVIDVGREGEALHHHGDVIQQTGRAGTGMVLHDSPVHGMLHCQESLPEITCPARTTPGIEMGLGSGGTYSLCGKDCMRRGTGLMVECRGKAI